MVFGRAKCGYCGIGFKYPKDFGMVRYCSAVCRVTAEPPIHSWEYKGCRSRRYYSRTRRNQYRRGDKIDPLVIYLVYGWTCHLCCGRIDPTLQQPDDWSATIDHVLPLSLGGKHSWDNVKPAHRFCNQQRDNK